jgi:uncharacterized membrane protein YkgB
VDVPHRERAHGRGRNRCRGDRPRVLIAVRPVAPRLSALGSLAAVLMFLTTLSFMLTTPGVWQPDLGFPFLSGAGQFLVKDLILRGAAVWTAGESLSAAAARAAT